MPPLLPHWGNTRVFVAPPGSIALKPPVPFGEDPSSAFYAEALEVFTMSQPLSRERRWIAELWSDDVPGLTVSPTGRWISIANQAVEKALLPFPETLEMYLKLGFALSDAMVSCWTSKYRFNVERPKAYIARVIRADWEPLHNAPSFPSYPSGHSALGAASAEILSSFLGQQFELTDRTHEGRQEFDSEPRTYSSFADMARENALSRISLGVHYRMDCEEGLRIGRLTGQKVLGIVLHKDEVAVVR